VSLPSSGTLSINDIAGEFGGSANPESLSEFYKGGSRVPNTTLNANIPTSGTIAISNFYNGSSVNSDIVTGTCVSTTRGSGKNITPISGIRITQTEYFWDLSTSSFTLINSSAKPLMGSWSDNLTDQNNVTINNVYSEHPAFVGQTSVITSPNFSALVGKSISMSVYKNAGAFGATAGTYTYTGTMLDTTPAGLGLSTRSSSNNNTAEFLDMSNAAGALTITWT
tara:strand:- start:5416 stop:6087 length:672 start_codon:yes stop_codon:yes gene_type:complete